MLNSGQPCQGCSETRPSEHLVLTQPLQDKTAPRRPRLSLAMSLTGNLYLEHKENCGDSTINRQMRAALSQRHQGRAYFEKVLVSCKRNSRTQHPNSRAGERCCIPTRSREGDSCCDRQRDKLACMAAGTVPWYDCFGDIAVHIREFKTQKFPQRS